MKSKAYFAPETTSHVTEELKSILIIIQSKSWDEYETVVIGDGWKKTDVVWENFDGRLKLMYIYKIYRIKNKGYGVTDGYFKINCFSILFVISYIKWFFFCSVDVSYIVKIKEML